MKESEKYDRSRNLSIEIMKSIFLKSMTMITIYSAYPQEMKYILEYFGTLPSSVDLLQAVIFIWKFCKLLVTSVV